MNRFFLTFLMIAALGARAQTSSFHFGGFVDGYYAWNANDPDNHENFVPGTGTTAKRANEFSLNLAQVEVSRDAAPVGFKVAVVAGKGADVVHSGEPGDGADTYRHVYQASLIYKATDKLTLEGGIYPSHIGMEGFYSKDNWNYTRSWLGEFSPYYQTGIKASYAFNGNWSGQVHVMNGWQIIGETDDDKSLGTQLAYSNDRLSASFNTFVDRLRTFGDVVVIYKATPRLSVGGSVDAGDQDDASWYGVAGYLRYAINDRSAVAVRVEQFDDPDNGISGTAQKLREATLTYEHRPADNLILKLEARHDRSTEPVFRDDEETQTLLIFGAVVTF